MTSWPRPTSAWTWARAVARWTSMVSTSWPSSQWPGSYAGSWPATGDEPAG
ncbi:MAG: hypothetical protein IPH80_28025 [Myxococcales bacterium]|nr:hypothetical protein [Myxococcales bacterium]